MAFHYLPDIGVSQVERKNYDNRLAYFNATNRDGGNAKSKSMVMQVRLEMCSLCFDLFFSLAKFHFYFMCLICFDPRRKFFCSYY